ncbi:hypothetical protein VMCG_03766 [Cytospora schulzeri]|uniref:BTB domain-containing protein n=1 Tax=Cytospora schulzeri TaxID=448051 RepID=A0A423WUM7_9PEZI|nr:hypothetical protein VMCG_03766 [Valsa malicola]
MSYIPTSTSRAEADKPQPGDEPVSNPGTSTKRRYMRSDILLLETGNFADAVIICGGKSWNVHKSIICSRCDWFRKALDGNFEEARTNTVTISYPEFYPEYIDCFISYIYSGVLDVSNVQRPDESPVEKCVRLWVIADFFLFKPLMKDTFALMETHLDVWMRKLEDRAQVRPHNYTGRPNTREGVDMVHVLFRVISVAYTEYPHARPVQRRIANFKVKHTLLIAWGWLPDDESSAVSISSLNSATGKKACFFGDYSKIDDTYDGSDITYKASKAEGAIMVPSVMPVGVKWSEVTEDLAKKIGTAMEAFTKTGLTVYLRFAHEMNCEDYDGFKQAWINVANVCKGIDGCYMMWSPNLQDLGTLKNWWPGTDYVDIVAVDHYPSSDSDVQGVFKGNYDQFYTEYVKPYGKPFILGETAYGGSAKHDWVKDVTNSDFSSYTLYKGAMWFEYNKEADFYVVNDASKSDISKFDGYFS